MTSTLPPSGGHTPGFLPAGTVYGVLLNFRAEVEALAPQMHEPPYKAPPKAPILYVKTANTWSPHGSAITVPAHVPEVEVGATIAMVIGPDNDVETTPRGVLERHLTVVGDRDDRIREGIFDVVTCGVVEDLAQVVTHDLDVVVRYSRVELAQVKG